MKKLMSLALCLAAVLLLLPLAALAETSGNGNGYTYYAYEDGYDVNVASGLLLMKAGYSYSFEMLPTMPQKQAEVRVMDTDEFVGYVLLNTAYDSNGSLTGLEVPEAFVDANGDGIISIQEMNDALDTLSGEAAKLNGTEAGDLSASISAVSELVSQGQIADAYASAKQIKTDVEAAAATEKVAAEKSEATHTVIIGICIAAAAVVLMIILILRKRKKKTTDDILGH